MAQDAKARIDELRKALDKHNYNYYVLNAPEISDYEFDMMMNELIALEKEHPEYADAASPTQRVGSDINRQFVQVEHRRPMLSLGNTYSIEEVEEFVARCKQMLGGEDFEIVGEMKYDGTSISLIYEHGKLTRAVTRGDGVKGDDVTANVKTIRSIPLQLRGEDYPDEFEVRGEVLMPWKVFEALNKERAFNEEPLFANPRNAAAGTLKLQNSAEVAKRNLDAYLYFLLGENLPGNTHSENMEMVKKWGFKTGQYQILHSIDEVRRFIAYWDTERKNLPIATDGLVFKVNSLRQQRNLGFTAKSPRWAVAYKFAPERECTQLKFVSFETGRSGVITPVANLEPVQLSGTIVKRASLHNEDIIRQLDIHEGDFVYVEKGGEIIPKIVGVDVKQRKPGSKPVEFVRTCPVCGTALVRVEGEAAWSCPNKYYCRPQITGRIEHFVSRHAMDIDGIGEEVAEQLYAARLVETVADIYDLTEHDLVTLERFGERSAKRILAGVEASKSVPFERVVYALSIPFVGETVAKKLAQAVKNIDNLMAMTGEQLAMIPEIGPKIAESIVQFFKVPINRVIVERLRIAGLRMQVEEKIVELKSNVLEGKSIIISGVFDYHSRDEYKQIIEQHGGKNVGSISAKTDYVLAGAKMGPAKLEKAKKLGIEIISETDFLKMIGEM
ncbi:MAG: NAD-dependent DNA ligase LigA [Bacteroidales bacterium]|nr:NAD-dependent DNA ligase LigA [Bacteroidales bacterium]